MDEPMESMTRTHWLLVILIGLLVWGFGYVAQVPPAETVGFFITVGALAAMLLGGDTFSRRPPRGERRRPRR